MSGRVGIVRTYVLREMKFIYEIGNTIFYKIEWFNQRLQKKKIQSKIMISTNNIQYDSFFSSKRKTSCCGFCNFFLKILIKKKKNHKRDKKGLIT